MVEHGLIAFFERPINLDEGVIVIQYSRSFRIDVTIESEHVALESIMLNQKVVWRLTNKVRGQQVLEDLASHLLWQKLQERHLVSALAIRVSVRREREESAQLRKRRRQTQMAESGTDVV